MKFMLLTHQYSGFQIHYDGAQLILEWYGPVDFTGAESIGLTNIHIFPLKRIQKNGYSAVIHANFIQPTLYNPQKTLATMRLDPHTDCTPILNYKGNFTVYVSSQIR